jgi:hypothetical protein
MIKPNSKRYNDFIIKIWSPSLTKPSLTPLPLSEGEGSRMRDKQSHLHGQRGRLITSKGQDGIAIPYLRREGTAIPIREWF